MRKIVITGGAGFIGSHVVEHVRAEYPNAHITVFDKMTYAADIRNLDGQLDWAHCDLMVGDLCDFNACLRLTQDVDCVLHLAAESHVDNSFGNSLEFTRSNTLGTHTLLEACRINDVPRIVHVSTDEVYGEIAEGEHGETDMLNPTNPYSASKAGGDMMALSYIHSFKLPITIVRGNNIFGIRQYPEKIIPKFILAALSGTKMTLHGNGQNRRRFLAAEDFAEAIIKLMDTAKHGEIYNVGTEDEYENNEIAQMLCAIFGLDYTASVIGIKDRPFNDFRYAMDSTKMHDLGWQPRHSLRTRLPHIVEWYRANHSRFAKALR